MFSLGFSALCISEHMGSSCFSAFPQGWQQEGFMTVKAIHMFKGASLQLECKDTGARVPRSSVSCALLPTLQVPGSLHYYFFFFLSLRFFSNGARNFQAITFENEEQSFLTACQPSLETRVIMDHQKRPHLSSTGLLAMVDLRAVFPEHTMHTCSPNLKTKVKLSLPMFFDSKESQFPFQICLCVSMQSRKFQLVSVMFKSLKLLCLREL